MKSRLAPPQPSRKVQDQRIGGAERAGELGRGAFSWAEAACGRRRGGCRRLACGRSWGIRRALFLLICRAHPLGRRNRPGRWYDLEHAASCARRRTVRVTLAARPASEKGLLTGCERAGVGTEDLVAPPQARGLRRAAREDRADQPAADHINADKLSCMPGGLHTERRRENRQQAVVAHVVRRGNSGCAKPSRLGQCTCWYLEGEARAGAKDYVSVASVSLDPGIGAGGVEEMVGDDL